jgi:hypothetical protein
VANRNRLFATRRQKRRSESIMIEWTFCGRRLPGPAKRAHEMIRMPPSEDGGMKNPGWCLQKNAQSLRQAGNVISDFEYNTFAAAIQYRETCSTPRSWATFTAPWLGAGRRLKGGITGKTALLVLQSEFPISGISLFLRRGHCALPPWPQKSPRFAAADGEGRVHIAFRCF